MAVGTDGVSELRMLVGAWIASCSRWYAAAIRRCFGRLLWQLRWRNNLRCSRGVRLSHDNAFLREAVARLAGLWIEPVRLSSFRIGPARRRCRGLGRRRHVRRSQGHRHRARRSRLHELRAPPAWRE